VCKIYFINPPSPYLINDASYPPSGLMYLAAAVEPFGHEVKIVDLAGNPRWKETVSNLDADLFGITCVTPNVKVVREISLLLPKGKPIVIGGVHPTFLPQDTLEQIRCDAIVQGEGEIVIKKLIHDLEQGNLKRTYRGRLVPVAAIPKPARHLVTLSKYSPGGQSTTPIYTSRGCPYRCNFCSKITAQTYRTFPLERVLDEMEEVMKFGYRSILFGDDDIGIQPDRLKNMLKAIMPLRVNFRLNQDARQIDEEMLIFAAKAGCSEISFGIESGSQKMLDLMNKHTTVEANRRAILETKKHGIKAKAYFVVNFPGEDERTIIETLKFVEETKPDKWLLSSFAPLPGSDTFRRPRHYGITWMSSAWEDYYLVGTDGQFKPCFETKELTLERQTHFHEVLHRGLKGMIG